MESVNEIEARDGSVVAAFAATMPERYRARFAEPAIRQHAWVAENRQQRPANVGLFDATESDGPALCVVARDAPGVLAAICASLVVEGFDVMQAEAFTRKTPAGDDEAVDLFWVRREVAAERTHLTHEDAQGVLATLVPLLRGEVGVRPRRTMRTSTPAASETSVRFLEPRGERHLTLELCTNDRTGLLLAVTAAMLAQRVQILASRITTDGRRVNDSFDLVEADGSRITRERLPSIQLAVMAAVDGY
jgi:[protein-PII] uridylyltransferase